MNPMSATKKSHKVANLIDAKLDAAVAKAEGKEWGVGSMRGDPYTKLCFIKAPSQRFDQMPDWFCPSTEWSDGGPIIERERIVVTPDEGEWAAGLLGHIDPGGDASPRWDPPGEVPLWVTGPTPLIAAMRAYVMSKFGEAVEL